MANPKYIQGLKTPLLSSEEEIRLARQVTQWRIISERMADSGISIDGLSDEERCLFYQGVAARQRMVEANLRLVASIAQGYSNPMMEFSDIFQDGVMGLIKAIERFDPERGNKFSTYAYWWIRQAINKEIAKKGRMVRLPIHISEKIRKVKRTISHLEATGTPVTIANIAQASEIPCDAIREILSIGEKTLSLDFPLSPDGDISFSGILADGSSDPTESLQRSESKESIEDAMAQLTPVEREVLVKVYGLDGEPPVSVSVISTALGKSRTRINQIRIKAEWKLRHYPNLKQVLGNYQ